MADVCTQASAVQCSTLCFAKKSNLGSEFALIRLIISDVVSTSSDNIDKE